MWTDSRGRERKTPRTITFTPVREMTEAEVAWLAGIYDGEGCIYFNKRNNTWALSVRMTDKDVIDRLAAVTGVGVVRTEKRRPQRKDIWQWRVNMRAQQAVLLRAMYPWLSKRRQGRIREFEAWLETAGPGREERVTTCLRGHDKADRTSRGDCRPCAVMRAAAQTARRADARR